MTSVLNLQAFIHRDYAQQERYGYTYINDHANSERSNESSDDSQSTQGSFKYAKKHGPAKNGKEKAKKSYQMKQKTELCKTYSLGLVCPYGVHCSFAHGTSELKSKVLVPARYKTTKCRDFHKVGFCKFGARCQFVHREHETDRQTTLDKMTYTSVFQTLEETAAGMDAETPVGNILYKGLNLPAYTLPRLSVFEKLASCQNI